MCQILFGSPSKTFAGPHVGCILSDVALHTDRSRYEFACETSGETLPKSPWIFLAASRADLVAIVACDSAIPWAILICIASFVCGDHFIGAVNMGPC